MFEPSYFHRFFNLSQKICSSISTAPVQSMKCVNGMLRFSSCRHQMENFPRYWPFVPGIHRSPVNYPHKGQWRGALTFSSISAWINGLPNNRKVGDLRRHRTHNVKSVFAYWQRCNSTSILKQGALWKQFCKMQDTFCSRKCCFRIQYNSTRLISHTIHITKLNKYTT